MASNKEKILSYIQQNKQATVVDLHDTLDIERVMIHRHLKALLASGLVNKIGSAPKVIYVPAEKQTVSVAGIPELSVSGHKIIEENFLLITPRGERLEGIRAFAKWCADRQYDVLKKAAEYLTLHKKYSALRKNGLLDGTRKITDTFGNDCRINRVYYVEFYAWEIFGKTKLGQLLLYAKQSQDRKMMKEIATLFHPYVMRLIAKYDVGAVGYIPPTVKRVVQLMSVLEKSIPTSLPELKLDKVAGEVRVPQKTLSKLEERIDNARATIFVADRRRFEIVLLIDDAVGSGATLNEVARKLKDQGVAMKVIGLSVTGSIKGFDVISEV